MDELLTSFFLNSFNSDDYYEFFHESELALNEVYAYISRIFDNPDNLLDQSINLAKQLYEQSTHPKIKGGEFYTVYFQNCLLDGENVDAIGLFKTENKDTFLKVTHQDECINLIQEQGINIKKLDKGCLIFDKNRENGYVVAIVDNTNKGIEAQYWIDDFLHLRQCKAEYANTQNIMMLAKNFVTKELPNEFEVTKADQIDLLNKSLQNMKHLKIFIFIALLTVILGGCQMILLSIYTPSTPTPKTEKQIANKARSLHLNHYSHLFANKEGCLSYCQICLSHSDSSHNINFDPLFFKNGKLMEPLETLGCTSYNQNMINILDSTDKYRLIDSITLSDLINNQSIINYDSINFISQTQNRDYVILLYWSSFESTIQQHELKRYEKMIGEAISMKNINAQVYYVNFDMRKEWEQ